MPTVLLRYSIKLFLSQAKTFFLTQFQHPKWTGVRGGFANDIALIRVPTNRPFNLNGAQVKAICLPPKREPPFDYTGIARVAGWGLTRDRGSPSRTLQFTDVSIISDK